jgi:hypothetical protein
VAASIESQLSVSPEVIEGGRGEFTVWVGADKVAQKTADGFPSDEDVLAAVWRALSG